MIDFYRLDVRDLHYKWLQPSHQALLWAVRGLRDQTRLALWSLPGALRALRTAPFACSLILARQHLTAVVYVL